MKTKKEKSAKRIEREKAIKEQLKSMIFPLILCAIIAVGIIVIINYQNTGEVAEIIELRGYEGDETPLVLENESLKLVMDPLTTQFTLEVKSTGKVWRSNPEGISEDSLAQNTEKDNLNSTLRISYCTPTGLEAPFYSYPYSVKNGIYEIEAEGDQIKVRYSLGNVDRTYIIPPVCLEAEFEEWLAKFDKQDAFTVKQNYKKYDINALSKRDNKEELLADYPILETEVIYVLRSDASKGMRLKMEGFFEDAGYTMEDYTRHAEMDNSLASSDKPIFNVDMIYHLEGNDLVVEIPLQTMEYKSEYPLYTVTPLPYFGAGGKDDEGYLFVPEGGGALINFNNGKVSQNNYYANIYGWDMALRRNSVVHDTRSAFNVFGISEGDDSFLCILEDGVSCASVQADVSGKTNSYNYVNAVYSVSVREQYSVGDLSDSSVFVFLDQFPDMNFTQRYRFVDSGDYSDMAMVYRDYLLDEYGDYLTEKEENQAPVVVEIVGAVDKVKQVLGVPTSRPLKLTTYKEAQEMIEQLHAEGMENLSVKLTGWCNGGTKQKMLKKAKTISALGSGKDLKAMVDSANALGVDVYLDGVTEYAYDSNIFNGFFSYTDAAKFLSKERAELYQYSAVTYAQREGTESYYLLHTDVAEEMCDNLVTAANSYNAGVSFRELGYDLSADYYRKNTVTRDEVRQRQVEQFRSIADSGQKIMINGGNEYAAVYSDVITNIDLQGNKYTILDTYVPFYHMALHGLVDYTGRSINIGGDEEEILLTSAEYGAGLSFTLMRETPFVLQKTLYTEYYGAGFDSWHDRMMEIYNRYNTELGHTFSQRMVGHEQITEDLSCTIYEDGTRVYVNYGYLDATTEGVTVPARDYKVVR